MKRILIYWFMLRIHKLGLCKPFHQKKRSNLHPKGWCPTLQSAYDLIKKYEK